MPRYMLQMATRALEPEPPSYRQDVYGWSRYQAALIRAGRAGEIDWENVAEEIESVGSSEVHRIRSALRLVLVHLLKWDFQPERRSRSWADTIRTQRLEYDDVLGDNPSLKPRQDELLMQAYRRARIEAAGEMDIALRTLPAACPFSWEQILRVDRKFTGDD